MYVMATMECMHMAGSGGTIGYSLLQLSELGHQGEQKCPNFETVANADSNPGSLDCESGVLPELTPKEEGKCHPEKNKYYIKPELVYD